MAVCPFCRNKLFNEIVWKKGYSVPVWAYKCNLHGIVTPKQFVKTTLEMFG